MGEIVKGLMTSLLASQWPLVAGAILCVAVGWLLRDGVEKIIGKIRKGKKNNNAGSRMEGHRTEHGNEDPENKAVADPNKENAVADPNKESGIAESLDWAARNIAKNKRNVFDLREIWIDAIEPVVNISIELMTKIQESGIICSSSIEMTGISKEGKEWDLYIIDDYIGDKGYFDQQLEEDDISNEIVQISIEIRLFLSFAKMEREKILVEKKKTLGIKGIFHKPGERIIGEWKDDRYLMHIRGEIEQSPRRGYDREGVYEMLEEQVKKAIEEWRKENC